MVGFGLRDDRGSHPAYRCNHDFRGTEHSASWTRIRRNTPIQTADELSRFAQRMTHEETLDALPTKGAWVVPLVSE